MSQSFGFRFGQQKRRRRGPSFNVTTVVIEGDSITNTTPGTPTNGTYGAAYAAANPGVTFHHRAQNSRGLGASGDTTAVNSLWGHQAEDIAFDPEILTVLIGANNLSNYPGGGSAYYDAVVDWAAPIRAAGIKVGIATVLPVDNHASEAAYMAQRAVFNPLVRAGVGTDFDFLIPFGDHPILNDPARWWDGTANDLSDGVHPTGISDSTATPDGHDYLLDVYEAVMDPLLEGNLTGTSPTISLGEDILDAPVSGSTTRYIVVTGLGMGVSGTAVLSGTNPSHTFALGTGSQGTSNLTNVHNGDVITVVMPHSASFETELTTTVTINGVATTLSITTTANLAPAEYTHVDIINSNVGFGLQQRTASGFVVPNDGLAIIFVNAYVSSATVQSATFGGQPCTYVASNSMGHLFTCEITAGTHNLTVTAVGSHLIMICASVGITQTGEFVAVVENTPTNENDPHLAPSLTCPGSGFIVGAYFHTDGDNPPSPVPTVNAPTTQVDYGFVNGNGQSNFLLVGELLQTGQMSFSRQFENPAIIAASFQRA